MSAYWRAHFTFNKYSQIAARAMRNSLKEEPRLAAEKRGLSELKYQKWDAGKASESQWVIPPAAETGKKAGGSAAVP